MTVFLLTASFDIEYDLDYPPTPKDISAFCQSMRKRFKVQIRPWRTPDKHGLLTFVIAALHDKQDQLEQCMDRITQAAESSGLGRVGSEWGNIEDLENLVDEE